MHNQVTENDEYLETTHLVTSVRKRTLVNTIWIFLLQACSCLSVLVPLFPDRIAESKGPEVLVQFLVATSDDNMKGLAARALLACCRNSAMSATLFGAGAIGVLLGKSAKS
jgi:hypothetical protein